jgi:hypothetical protein
MVLCANCGDVILDRRVDAVLCKRCGKAARWARNIESRKRQRLIRGVEKKLGLVVDSLPGLIRQFGGNGELKHLRQELKGLIQNLRGD